MNIAEINERSRLARSTCYSANNETYESGSDIHITASSLGGHRSRSH
jgi:hypothetical protein